MLVLQCQAGTHRFAFDAAYVGEVAPLVNLLQTDGAPAYSAGRFIYRAEAAVAIDLLGLISGRQLPVRWSTRIVIFDPQQLGLAHPWGLVAENIQMLPGAAAPDMSKNPLPGHWGPVLLDDQGLYEWIDVRRLANDARIRSAWLDTPAAGGGPS